MQAISGGNTAQQEFVHAIEELTQAVLQANLPATEQKEVVEALSTITEQDAKKPEERSMGMIKALVVWLPTAIAAASNLTTLWDKVGPSIKAYFHL